MTSRDKHLLEVFKDLGDGEAQPPSVAPSPRPAREPRRSAREAGEGGGPRLSPQGRLGLFFGLAVVVALAVGYLLGGGGSEDSVRAGEIEEDPLAFLGDNPTEAEVGGPAQVAEESAQVFAQVADLLADPANEYTVVAITYDNNKNNEQLAWSTVYHFAERGLPVGPPYGRGGLLYILVGASPTVKELAPLRDRVRVQLDPAGRREEYKSAYVARIDQVISDR